MKGSITVALVGGLGNQLFQYAAGRALSLRTGGSLLIDLSWFDEVLHESGTTIRKYSLEPFKLPLRLMCKKSYDIPKLSRFGSLLSCLRGRLGLSFGIKRYYEKSYCFDVNVLNLQAPVWLSGYWQSYRYFEDIANLIRQEIGAIRNLSPESQSFLEQIQSTNSVCIHIRRGDYVSSKAASEYHGLCSIEYYQHGVEVVTESVDSPQGFVFTDDPVWVRENLSLRIPFTLVDANGPDNAHQDIWLMAACKYFIIANSSLSWWGAWLCPDKEKRVVYPARWFTNPNIDTSDLFPANWIRLEI